VKRAIRVGPITAASGDIARGFLRLGDLADGQTPIQIPVVVINGADDGPLVYLHAGSHGQETAYAVDMMRRLSKDVIRPDRVRGAVILVPIANPLAHFAASRIAPHYGVREGGAFGGDMHKLWPGDPRGSITQRLCAAIWEEIVAQSTVIVDFHTNSSPGIPFVLMYRPDDAARVGSVSAAWTQSLDLASAGGLTIVTGASTPNTLAGASLLAGKAGLTVEIPSPRMIDARLVRVALRATTNLLVRLAMTDGSIEPQIEAPPIPGQHQILPSLRANRGGIVHFEANPGVLLPEGSLVARIVDVFGDVVEEVRMPETGYVSTYPPLSWAAAQAIATGDYVADCFS
jgi:predicted deacylase